MAKKEKTITAEAIERALKNPDALYQELNLLKVEGVVFSFDTKNTGSDGKIYEVMEYVKNPEGKTAERPIVVEPNPRYGRPSLLAYKLLNVIIKKLSERGVHDDARVSFTFSELSGKIGRSSWGGRNAAQIFEALSQIQSTNVSLWGYNKALKEWANYRFSIFSNVYVIGTKGQFSGGFVTLDQWIISNLLQNYHRTINYARITTLDPIAIALYKHVYNIFATRYSHRQHPTFEKNYINICAEWLGGLKPQKHKSRILQQLGPHLEQLKEVKLLRSYEIQRNASREWKLKFTPGNGFKEDYDSFYRKAIQPSFAFAYHEEKKKIQGPLELVYYFYSKLYNTKNANNISVYSPREADLAKFILLNLTSEEGRAFVDFALAQAAATGFNIKTFGGLRQYLPAWSAIKEQLEAKKQKEEKQKEERRQEEAKQRYETFRKGAIAEIRIQMSPQEISRIEGMVRNQILIENPMPFGLDMLVRIRTDALLAKDFNVPTFEEWNEGKIPITRSNSE